MSPSVYAWLQAASAVVGLLTTDDGEFHVYQDEAPQKSGYPCLVWGLIAGSASSYVAGASSSDFGRYQFNVLAPTQDERDAIVDAVVPVLEEEGLLVSHNGAGKDEVTKQYFYSFDFQFWVPRQ